VKAVGYKTTAVGLVIAVSLTLAAVAILTIGREQGLFRDRVSFMTSFPNATGLSAGSPVRFIGVQVGIVKKVSLPEEVGAGRVDVELGIDRDVRARIREGTTATLKNLTYLSGEKYVELKPGGADQALLEEGAYIQSPRSEIQKLIAQSQTIATNIEDISVQFKDILASLNAGESVLSQLIKDPEFGQQMVSEITATLANLNSVVARIERGEGFVGRLLADDEFGRTTFETITTVLQRVDRITAQVEAGEGFLGQLLVEDSALNTLPDDLGTLVADLRDIVGKIDSGQGLVGQLVVDEDYGRTMTLRLDAALAAMTSILQKIDEGEGTLSLLLNEPRLYDEATEVVGGLSDSRFLTWVARRMRNKDIKRQIEEYAKEVEEAEKAARE
jgi:phospholipid/cholesterol/gamma-HCH transport system substrate-binding protein